jgi:hypothetical protein
LAEAAHVSGAIRAGGLRGDRANIDTNREHLRPHYMPKGLPNTAPKFLCSGPAHQIIAKAIEVLLRLEADQIVSAKCDGFRDYLMMRWARAEERTRQTKGAATDMFGLQPLRHISSRRASMLS